MTSVILGVSVSIAVRTSVTNSFCNRQVGQSLPGSLHLPTQRKLSPRGTRAQEQLETAVKGKGHRR